MQISQRVGDEVRVRRSRWRVVGIDPHDDCALFTLRGTGAHNLGAECQVITPFDRVEPVERPRRLRVVGARTWRRACQKALSAGRYADDVQTIGDARIEPFAYQLEPASAILRGDATRILIADEVGLGKTIQAALIATELRSRGDADRILILTPAGLREQWRDELAERFDLRFAIVDARDIRARLADLPPDVNPWSTLSLAIVSLDYAKRPEILPAIAECWWDLVVIDEAHTAAFASDRHAAVSTICAHAAYVVLLTATPHNGDSEAFASLRALGAHDDGLLLFRRTRESLGIGTSRHVHLLAVRSSAAERKMHAALERFSEAVRREWGPSHLEAGLGLSVLRKRALSSARSLEHTVTRRLAALKPSRDPGQQMTLPFDDGRGEFDGEDLEPAWTVPPLNSTEQEHDLLTALASAAHDASGSESKVRALTRLLVRLRARGESAVVFTEYRDTLTHLATRLPFESVVLHGGMTRDERRTSLQAFVSGRCGVLLATDAAGEGLNLHQTCRVVINLELPWNPMRLEQRAGRVDRIGQPRAVHAFHLLARDLGEGVMVDRLRTRIARARDEVDSADPLSRHARTARTALDLRIRHVQPAHGKPRTERPAQDVLVMRARRPRLRRWLGSRVLALAQSKMRDACGRTLAVHVTPLMVNLSAGSTRASALPNLWLEIERRAADLPDPARDGWLATNRSVHGRFRETRTARELAIWQALHGGHESQFQPGLFDHRAERRHQCSADRHNERIREAARRVEASRLLTDTQVSAPRVVLLLVP